jgi:putative membrane-bound dehydrogenase-like protein
MRLTLGLSFVAVAALGAAQLPQIVNTNTVPGGMGAPPKTAEEALAEMKLPAGFKASVFAAEPDVQNAIQLTWDTRGRLWVAENYTMDSDRFTDKFLDRIVIFDNADGGTRFKTRRMFTEQLKNLMGFAIGYGGVWAMTSPNILFIPDRNADGVPDGPAEVVFDGFSYTGGNMHTSANGLEFGIDGWIYGRTGHAHVQSIGPPGTPASQRARLHGSIFRFHPVTRAFEALSSGTVNPWGQDWDKHGEHFFDSTIVGHLWYAMPGAKFVSSSAEPNLKTYELIDHIGDHRFAGGSSAGTIIAPGGGGRRGGRGGAGGGQAAGAVPPAGAGRGEPPATGERGRGAGAVDPATAAQGRGAAAGGAEQAAAGRGREGRSWQAGPWVNGHSVVGMMIYQGDNWPASYRDRVYLLNLFGHRTNVETLERSGSGFVSRRAPEPDLFDMQDPWFRGIDISYGPDGGVFISDWTDTGDYHNRTGENRLSGRIYKITFGDAKASAGGSDLARVSVDELVALNTHANEWFPRQARVEFSNRLVDGRGVGNAKQLLRDQFSRETDVTRKLRALWTLYTIGGTDEAFLLPLLKSTDEHLRAWGIRILSEHWPIDALLTRDDAAAGATRIWIQQRPAPAVGGAEVTVSPAVLAELARLAASDRSSLVRLVLASTLQRMPFGERPAVASGLVSHTDDATDKNIPLMVWYALIPLAETDPTALASIGAKSELRATRKYIARRLAEDITTRPGPVDTLVAGAATGALDYLADIADGLTLGLQGQQGVAKPAAWDAFVKKASLSSNPEFAGKVLALDALVGGAAALDAARRIALDDTAAAPARRAALQSLLGARAPDLRQIAQQLLRVRTVNGVAATALATFNDPTIAPMLIDAYPQFDAADRPRLIAALSSRPAYAASLLDAVAAGRIPRSAIAAIDARQMRDLNDAAITRRLGDVWGEVRDTPEARKQLMTTYKAELTPDRLAAADLSQGRAVFAAVCGSCHILYGEGGKFGPDLTGGERRHDLDLLLAKIVDPSAELPVTSRYTIVKLKDGRTVSGIVDNRTATMLTLRTSGDPVTIAVAEIQSTEQSSVSIMPEGLFEALTAEQRRNLVAYLMSKAQVPMR